MPFDFTEEQAVEAGKICGALLFKYLWQLQQDSAGPVTIPIQKPLRKYMNSKQAADYLGIGRTRFFDLRKHDPEFPKSHQTPSGKKYLRTDVERFARRLNTKKA